MYFLVYLEYFGFPILTWSTLSTLESLYTSSYFLLVRLDGCLRWQFFALELCDTILLLGVMLQKP